MIYHNPHHLDEPLHRHLTFIPQELNPMLPHNSVTHEPTPDEIRQRCAEIRQTWSKSTERNRRGEPERRYVELSEVLNPDAPMKKEWY